MPRIWKLEIQRLLLFRLCGKATSNHFCEDLYTMRCQCENAIVFMSYNHAAYLLLRLGLLCILGSSVSESCNVLLHTLDLLLLPLVLFPLIFFFLGFRLNELVVISVVIDKFSSARKVDHVSTNVIQEILRMRNQKKNAIPSAQIVFQPYYCFHIQVIGRFIEQQTA